MIQRLIPLIPRANAFDADGTPRFVGSAPAVTDQDRLTIDVKHNTRRNDRFQAFYGSQWVRSIEPTSQGNNVPGFGATARPSRSVLAVSATQVFGSTLLNEARFGRTRLDGGTFPASPLNPLEYGIRNGVTNAIGLPQMIVAGAVNFGGPGTLPQGRFDTSYVVTDTLSRAKGAHSIKFGGEYRHFINENFAVGTGVFNFPSVTAFLSGTANAFNITLGERRSVIDQRAVGLFFQDQVTVHDRLTVELGVRYEWHVTPTERDNRFVVFDASDATLSRIGEIYRQNNRNFEPRVGVAWQISGDGRTVLRAGYARAVDEPGTTAVRDTASNPPFGVPLTATGTIPLVSAVDAAAPAGLAPSTTDQGFRNASMQSWNVNVQRQLAGDLAVTLGYLGSHGTNCASRATSTSPSMACALFSPYPTPVQFCREPGVGNITQVESSGFSNYDAAFVSMTKRLSSGFKSTPPIRGRSRSTPIP